jgi:hypothetical protein
MSQLPTKDEIRQKYGITETDFEILSASNLPQVTPLMQEGAYLENKGLWGDLRVWLKKTIGQRIVIAVIFIGAFAAGIEEIGRGADFIFATTSQIADYTAHFSDYTKGPPKGFLVHTLTPPASLNMGQPIWTTYSSGTEMFPVSGSWPRS